MTVENNEETTTTETAEVAPVVAEQTIADIFADDSQESEKVEAVQETETVEVEAETKETESTEVVPTTTEEVQTVPISALQDERRKRQELQAKLDEKDTKVEIPDQFEDPDAYNAYWSDKSAKDQLTLKKSISRGMMQEIKDDYDEMEKVFIQQIAKFDDVSKISENEFVVDQMNKSDNPAKFVYDEAKKFLKVQQLSDPDYEAKLRESIKTEILAELKADTTQNAEPTAVNAAKVPDLTTASAAGTNSVEAVKAIETIADVFND